MTEARVVDLPTRFGVYDLLQRVEARDAEEVWLGSSRDAFGFAWPVVVHFVGREVLGDEPRRDALAAEAVRLARLHTPFVVRFHGFVDEGARAAWVTEYVDGLSLQTLLEVLAAAGAPLCRVAALFVAHRVFSGLAAAHGLREGRDGARAPLIHGDVRCANVRIGWDGTAKLGGLRLRALGDGDEEETRLASRTTDSIAVSRAPEQLAGQRSREATDVYLACVLLCEALGATPFPEGPADARRSAMEEGYSMAGEPWAGEVSPALRSALRRGLCSAVVDRTLTAVEMVGILRAELGSSPGREELVAAMARARPLVPAAPDEAESGGVPSSARPADGTACPHRHSDDDLPLVVIAHDEDEEEITLPGQRALQGSAVSVAPSPRGDSSPAVVLTPSGASTRPPSRRPSSPVLRQAFVVRRSSLKLILSLGALAFAALGLTIADRQHRFQRVVSVVQASPVSLQASVAPPSSVVVVTASAPPSVDPKPPRDGEGVEPVPAHPPSDEHAAPVEPAASTSTSAFGVLELPPLAKGHRVFLDGVLLPLDEGSVPAPCGPHTIRVGRTGAPHPVDVPCER